MIRSVPANQFTAASAADRFSALNLTIAYPIVRTPIVPSALTDDPEFGSMLESQLVTAESALVVDYSAKDEHFRAAVAVLPMTVAVLGQLKSAVADHPGAEDVFRLCSSAINLAERRARAAQNSKGASQFGNLPPLLPADVNENGEDLLRQVVESCNEANAGPQDPVITAGTVKLTGMAEQLKTEFQQIDQEKAKSGAVRELSIAKRTLNTLLYQANIFSVGPALMLDAARLSNRNDHVMRYGAGAGVRFTLVSSVNFTVGWMFNVNRGPSESRGALTVSMQFRDFLQ
jgi:hypothetical protein